MKDRTSLNHTAVVVLGLVAWGFSNGWQITQAVDKSTRFFWSASRGGVYPELRKLEAAGLLQATDDPRGEVTRHNYTVTDAGQAELDAWLTSTVPGAFDLRSEDLLRLFFGSGLTRDQQLAILRKIRTGHEQQLADLAQVGPPPAEGDGISLQELVLDYGVALHSHAARWCVEAEKHLTDAAT